MKTLNKTQEKILSMPSPCLRCKVKQCGSACETKFVPWFSLKWQTLKEIFSEEENGKQTDKNNRKRN